MLRFSPDDNRVKTGDCLGSVKNRPVKERFNYNRPLHFWIVAPARPRLSIPRFGVTEVLSGLAVVIATALGTNAAR